MQEHVLLGFNSSFLRNTKSCPAPLIEMLKPRSLVFCKISHRRRWAGFLLQQSRSRMTGLCSSTAALPLNGAYRCWWRSLRRSRGRRNFEEAWLMILGTASLHHPCRSRPRYLLRPHYRLAGLGNAQNEIGDAVQLTAQTAHPFPLRSRTRPPSLTVTTTLRLSQNARTRRHADDHLSQP